jgi:hypothetical protein
MYLYRTEFRVEVQGRLGAGAKALGATKYINQVVFRSPSRKFRVYNILN